MNPPSEDPNNHVPEVSPEDEWSDSEATGVSDEALLPPRREKEVLPSDRGDVAQQLHVLGYGEADKRTKTKTKGNDHDGMVVNRIVSNGAEEAADQNDSSRARGGKKNQKQSRAGGTDAGKSVGKKKPARSSEVRYEEEVARLPVKQVKKPMGLRVSKIGEESESKPAQEGFHAEKSVLEVASEQDGQTNNKRKKRKALTDTDVWHDEVPSGSAKSRWVLVSGAVVIFLVITAVFLSHLLRQKQDDSRESVFSKIEKESDDANAQDETILMMKEFNDSQEKARKIFGEYMTAKSPQDLKAFIYNAEGNMPILEKIWEPKTTREDWVPSAKSGWNLVVENGSYHAVLSGVGPDFEKFVAYFRMDETGVKLDWRATAGYGTATFEELNNGVGDTSEIRTVVSLSDFYTYAMPENRYRCYRLVSPDGEKTVWGYVRIGSPQDEKMKEFFLPREITGEVQREVSLTLGLGERVEAALKNQWMIENIKSDNWIE